MWPSRLRRTRACACRWRGGTTVPRCGPWGRIRRVRWRGLRRRVRRHAAPVTAPGARPPPPARTRCRRCRCSSGRRSTARRARSAARGRGPHRPNVGRSRQSTAPVHRRGSAAGPARGSRRQGNAHATTPGRDARAAGRRAACRRRSRTSSRTGATGPRAPAARPGATARSPERRLPMREKAA